MKSIDIIIRAFENIKTGKGRSKKSIISIAIGICCLIIMVSLFKGADIVLKSMGDNIDELLEIKVSGRQIEKGKDYFSGGSTVVLGRDEWNLLNENLKDNVKSIYKKVNFLGLELGCFKENIFRTNTVLVSFDTLKESKLKYYQGSGIKDINGAIVSRSFIEKALTQEQWDNNVYSNLKEIDVLGEVINFKYLYNTYESDNITKNEINIDVRIDGVIEDDFEYFGDIDKFEEDYPLHVFNDSVIYIPIERVEVLSKEIEKEIIDNYEVIIRANDIESMDKIIMFLEDNNFSIISDYQQFISYKYINFVAKLIFGVLAILILTTAVIGIINTMIMSVVIRKKEVAILKAIGANIRNIKAIYITESAMIGALGGAIGLVLGTVIYSIINFISINYMGQHIGYLSLNMGIIVFVFSILICIISSIPCLGYISKITVFHGVK